MEGQRIFRVYRVATENPPPDEAYLTPRELGRKPRKGATEEEQRSLDGLSCWDSEEGARAMARRFPKIGHLIVRYDIPEGAGLTWDQTIQEGHYDLWGDREARQGLKRYLASDFLAEV